MLEFRERCSCGAEFCVRDAPLTEAKRLLREWRRVHECSVSEDVGMVASTTNAVVERGSVVGFRWSEPVEFEEDKR